MQKKERTLLLVFLVAILLAGSVYLYGGKQGQEAQVPLATANVVTTSEQQRTSTNQALLRVHVKGEVNQPGVIQIPADSRVIDAIQAAGGAKAGADLEKLNLAAVVADGAEVIVPKAGAAEAEQQAAPESTNGGKININTASAEELDKLPGIGSTRAAAIVDYRKEHGRFLQVEDLKQVPGIGVKMLDQIRDKVTVN